MIFHQIDDGVNSNICLAARSVFGSFLAISPSITLARLTLVSFHSTRPHSFLRILIIPSRLLRNLWSWEIKPWIIANVLPRPTLKLCKYWLKEPVISKKISCCHNLRLFERFEKSLCSSFLRARKWSFCYNVLKNFHKRIILKKKTLRLNSREFQRNLLICFNERTLSFLTFWTGSNNEWIFSDLLRRV